MTRINNILPSRKMSSPRGGHEPSSSDGSSRAVSAKKFHMLVSLVFGLLACGPFSASALVTSRRGTVGREATLKPLGSAHQYGLFGRGFCPPKQSPCSRTPVSDNVVSVPNRNGLISMAATSRLSSDEEEGQQNQERRRMGLRNKLRSAFRGMAKEVRSVTSSCWTMCRKRRRNAAAAAMLSFAVFFSTLTGGGLHNHNYYSGNQMGLDATTTTPRTELVIPNNARPSSSSQARAKSIVAAGNIVDGAEPQLSVRLSRGGSEMSVRTSSARASAVRFSGAATTAPSPVAFSPKTGSYNDQTSLTFHGSQHVQPPSRLPVAMIGSNKAASINTRNGNGNIKNAVKDAAKVAKEETKRTLREAFDDLTAFMAGPKSDTLLLLLATALVTPLCKRIDTSPILGFLAAGMLMGPNGAGLISGIHTTETLAELGIVFFLFEMGIELSVERLMSMKRDVFGLGMGQFIGTAAVVAAIGKLAGLPGNALVVLGGGLALSSSAFVLQLLKDKDQMATRFGRASFGVLLFQDLAVVPLLVVTPILAGSGSLAAALSSAVIKAAIALGSIAIAGRVFLNPLFRVVATSRSQEAFLGVMLLTVLSMSFLTEGLGLSNTLGAFLAGVLLSETKYRYQVEADIAPFRGILLGLFFVTVGFEIDLKLIALNLPKVAAIVGGIITVKTLVTTALSLAFGLSLANAQQTGFLLSQGGEFAFVAFGLARGLGILTPETTKLMLTCIALTMALTPFLMELSAKIAQKFEEESDFSHYLGQDREAIEIKESEDFVVVAGYGIVGKVVCDLLDSKFVKYVGLEINPNKAIQARNKGLPVFYGDIGRPEVCHAFNVGKAKAAIIAISEQSETNRVVISLRRQYPDLKIFARAKDANHQARLQKTLDVVAMIPFLPEDNELLTLPFGGAVLRALGSPAEEVNAILEAKRKDVLSSRGLDGAEEQTVMAQLGVQPTNGKEDAQDDMKGASPMVAEVVEANTTPRGPTEEEKNGNVIDVSGEGDPILEVTWPTTAPTPNP